MILLYATRRLKFMQALKGSRSSGNFANSFGGEKNHGESVTSARSYGWPPCQGSLWNGLFCRIHWKAIHPKSPANLVPYIDLALKAASDVVLRALTFTYALGLRPSALS